MKSPLGGLLENVSVILRYDQNDTVGRPLNSPSRKWGLKRFPLWKGRLRKSSLEHSVIIAWIALSAAGKLLSKLHLVWYQKTIGSGKDRGKKVNLCNKVDASERRV